MLAQDVGQIFNFGILYAVCDELYGIGDRQSAGMELQQIFDKGLGTLCTERIRFSRGFFGPYFPPFAR